MNDKFQSVQSCPGPVSRRGFLQTGMLGMSGLTLAEMLRVKAQAAELQREMPDTSVIFVWLPGGAPHTETYDLKPNAPREYRGEFNPIASTIPGMDFCELLPLHAKTASRFNIVRSICHEFADHGGGHKRFLTGRLPKEPAGFVNDAPACGSLIAESLKSRNRGVPNYVIGADSGRQDIDVFSFGYAYLPPTSAPFIFHGDPSHPQFQVQNLSLLQGMETRIDDRRALLSGLDNLNRQVDRSGLMDGMDEFNRQALNLVTSQKARNAFDLSQEPQTVRDMYGMHAYGQRALMARRLVEAGVTFVTMVWENPLPGKPLPEGVIYNWDSHAVNGHIFNDAKVRLPMYDQAVSALVNDLYDRGLDRRVLLIVTGEFGRTPRVTYANDRPGRDHWPQAMSLLVAGGGMKTGQVIGSTTSRAEEPATRRMSPNDLWATVYRHLGIDWTNSFPDHSGRPMPILPFGEPISELLPA